MLKQGNKKAKGNLKYVVPSPREIEAESKKKGIECGIVLAGVKAKFP